ncbi:hypothetical protein SAMN05443550_106106 [Pedobacter hartonius]|uniref:Uncharacterized protein n=1 Tax=Pedobacter hartonius TaxID=425514 RepID=A0A1H4ERB8_9SPHI|nr:hypothetical protein SAMN05443550_106106 [Pedobacter hartonius]
MSDVLNLPQKKIYEYKKNSVDAAGPYFAFSSS